MTTIQGIVEPEPIATGRKIEIAPDDPEKHVSIRTTNSVRTMEMGIQSQLNTRQNLQTISHLHL